ncbi:response regulator transcription factor [Alteromonas pelagimontana]|uniref:Response regulator transcription factor n=1 Tax=Alteromonas pelagimontana TaxID=1858656 RepID=A0A6M4MD17_9ALTE|nr:response regulator transcription factor [Alteromonas pelagimontana]QJR81081.1 response regulator transcription factor [Alteromonas pelagimontana]
MINIALIDDHLLVRESFAHLLSTQPNWQVVAQWGGYAEVENYCGDTDFDIALVDISLPDRNGLDVAQLIKKTCSHSKIIMVSMYEQYHYITQAIGIGAMGYVSKRAAADEIIEAVKAVSKGEVYLTREILQVLHFNSGGNDARIASLTTRELEIFILLAKGHNPKKVAQLTDTMPKTILTHRANIYRKLNAASPFDLLRIGLQSGTISFEEFL